MEAGLATICDVRLSSWGGRCQLNLEPHTIASHLRRSHPLYRPASAFTMRSSLTRTALNVSLPQALLLSALLTNRQLRGEQPTFERDVMAVLSKAGCNMGTCHGNLNGKGWPSTVAAGPGRGTRLLGAHAPVGWSQNQSQRSWSKPDLAQALGRNRSRRWATFYSRIARSIAFCSSGFAPANLSH